MPPGNPFGGQNDPGSPGPFGSMGGVPPQPEDVAPSFGADQEDAEPEDHPIYKKGGETLDAGLHFFQRLKEAGEPSIPPEPAE